MLQLYRYTHLSLNFYEQALTYYRSMNADAIYIAEGCLAEIHFIGQQVAH